MASRKLLSFLSLVAVVSAGSLVLHEKRTGLPAGFTNKGVAPSNEVLTLRVGLASNNIAGLQQKLLSISTPGSAEFREWLSKDDIKSFVQPSAATVSAFNAFVSANGLNSTVISPNGEWLSITLPVSQANTLFGAKFEKFWHPNITSAITRTMSVSLPAELVGHVDVLHPTTAFARPNPRIAAMPSELIHFRGRAPPVTPPTSCEVDALVTPACLQSLYGIPTTAATQPNNTLLVTGYVEEYVSSSDVEAFLENFRPDTSSATTFTLQTLDGGVNPVNDGSLEADTDVEYTIGIATEVPVTFLSVGGGDTDRDFFTALLDTTTYLSGVDSPPTVMTTSYGENEQNVGLSVASKICDGYMALSARGISVVFASGDGGVRGNQDSSSQCSTDDFIAVFPASCPYVTSVGATVNWAPEVTTSFSGGGFSSLFEAQPWQADAIATFLDTGIPANFSGVFNSSGRGYPDVSAQGDNISIVWSGSVLGFGGTSISSPIFASIVALVNDQLIAAGKPQLGFLNPFLYANPSAFTDITIGYNSGDVCGTTSSAFNATVGWDPLSGLGTPIFDSILAAALA